MLADVRKHYRETSTIEQVLWTDYQSFTSLYPSMRIKGQHLTDSYGQDIVRRNLLATRISKLHLFRCRVGLSTLPHAGQVNSRKNIITHNDNSMMNDNDKFDILYMYIFMLRSRGSLRLATLERKS